MSDCIGLTSSQSDHELRAQGRGELLVLNHSI